MRKLLAAAATAAALLSQAPHAHGWRQTVEWRQSVPPSAENASDAGALPCMLDERGKPAEPCNIEKNSRDMVARWISENSTVLEVGARYGSVSCVIAQRQLQSGKLVSVEPDKVVWEALDGNLARHHCNATVLKGAVGTQDVQVIHEGPNGYGTRTIDPLGPGEKNPAFRGFVVPHWSLKEVERKYGLHFDTLVADCEGCFPTLLKENPGLIEQVNLVIAEVHTKQEEGSAGELLQQGFKLVEEIERQRVYQRVSPAPAA